LSIAALAAAITALVLVLTLPATALEGIQAEFAVADGGLFLNGANIVFNTVVNDASGNIAYNAGTGVFTITDPGNYLANWWVASDGAGPAVGVSYTLEVNGAPYTTVSSPIVSGQTSGTALITVGAAPVTVSLINSTGEDIFIPATIPVQAGITITR
jgi:hypothetical protein